MLIVHLESTSCIVDDHEQIIPNNRCTVEALLDPHTVSVLKQVLKKNIKRD